MPRAACACPAPFRSTVGDEELSTVTVRSLQTFFGGCTVTTYHIVDQLCDHSYTISYCLCAQSLTPQQWQQAHDSSGRVQKFRQTCKLIRKRGLAKELRSQVSACRQHFSAVQFAKLHMLGHLCPLLLQAWPLLLSCYAPDETVAGRQAVKYVWLASKQVGEDYFQHLHLTVLSSCSESCVSCMAVMQLSRNSTAYCSKLLHQMLTTTLS